MKKIFQTTLVMLGLAFTAQAQVPVKNVSGNLLGNVNWSNDTIYMLQGKVYAKSGTILNIAPGTLIKGDKSTPGSALIIVRGAKINAIGTPEQPIVFTSSETPGNRSSGDWGGLVVAGNARVNVTGGIGTLEGGNLANPDGEVTDGQYGGLNDLDNSGELRYVRIEYAGYAFAPNSELNSLTLAGVGSGTKISYIQCSYGFDDAFEFFGGTVSAHHLVAFRGNDDDFDTDFGYSGKVQFGVCLRDTNFADAVSGAMGFESDNDGSGTGNSPYTSATFSNMTLVGPQHTPTTVINSAFKRGAHIRRNSRQSIFNSIFMGWPTGVKVEGDSCHNSADNGILVMQNNVIAACAQPLDSTTSSTPWGITAWYMATANNNTNYANNSDVMLTDPFTYSAPDFRPATSSPVLAGAAFTHSKLASGFTTVAYRGAFGTDNWMAGWTNFNPDNSPYTQGWYPTSVTTKETLEGIQLYPNPITSGSSFQLSFNNNTNQSVSVIIRNITGENVWNQNFNSSIGYQTISINPAITSGLYFVEVKGQTSSKTFKLNVLK